MRIPHSFTQRMIGKWYRPFLHYLPITLALLIVFQNNSMAEGSKDFLDRPGYRMFLDTRGDQQMKVFVKENEFINLGSSHLGIQGGFIKIYRPDGTLHETITGNNGAEGIIYNELQEANGPIGNSVPGMPGYIPWAYQVPVGGTGVWTVIFDYPTYVGTNFANLKNDDPWTRLQDQPNTTRVVLAWDITVTETNSGNNFGKPIEGRVYTNEYVSIINQNGFVTSPVFQILTRDGFVFEVEFKDTDPFRFPLSSNNVGFVENDLTPVYNSQPRSMINRSDDPSAWTAGSYYLYEPQAEDLSSGTISNNKIFFNEPDEFMPKTAPTTDIFRNNSHDTWLIATPQFYTVNINNFEILGNSSNNTCDPGTILTGASALLSFESNVSGTASLSLDMTGDGDFDDLEDRIIFQYVSVGQNQIEWDGKNGLGAYLPASTNVNMKYLLEVKGGETHILLTDIENNNGGVTFELVKHAQAGTPTDLFYYDHSPIGGAVSGGGSAGNPMSTNVPFTYDDSFGDNKILDYWAFFDYDGEGTGTLVFDIVDDCIDVPDPDRDNDGIADAVDLDDDNDGVPDKKEFCNSSNGFSCLPGGFDPSGDQDGDGVPNYVDANDPAFTNNCIDINNDGVCEQIMAVYDTDGDGVADHHDLDSDNDGITDLDEAGHNQPDANRNGIIDGLPAAFGQNGLYNPIASNPNGFNAVETYTRFDEDSDNVPDHDDLDSDNDGINDVAEAGYTFYDTDNDGRIDDGNGQVPTVGFTGLTPIIDPFITGSAIPYPKDNDGDGIPDWHDLDSDNDLIHDVEEGGSNDPDNNAIIGTGSPSVNADGQAIGTTSKPHQTDNDNIPDYHDLDSDNDGINDVREANGIDQNNDGLPGIGPIIIDSRGIPIGSNGYAHTGTSLPVDTDTDLVRDYRDLDSDNDNINDVAETNKPDPDNDGRIGTGIPSVNSNGQATANAPTSAPTDTDADGIPDFRELDSDDDGINDVTEANKPDPDFDGIVGSGIPAVDVNGMATSSLSTSKPTDSDNDDTPDFQQLDSDTDGILDNEECPTGSPCRDGDNDQTPDFQDPDRDNDGIADSYECETGFPCPDTDGDSIPDVDDLDTDGDSISDTNECPLGNPCPDTNNNNIPQWREFDCNPNIALPIANGLPANLTFCIGNDLMLSANNAVDVEGDSVRFEWFGPNGLITSGQTTENGPFELNLTGLNTNNSGDYTLHLYTEEGCLGNPSTVSLSVSNGLDAPSLNLEEDLLCEGQTLELESTTIQGANIEYEWWFDNGSGIVSIGTTNVPSFYKDNLTVADGGLYYVSVNAGGCSSSLSNSQDLTIDNVLTGMAPVLSLDEDLFCEGQTLELNSTPYPGSNVFYNWMFDDGTGNVSIGVTNVPTLFIPDATAANTGIYSIEIIMGNCSSQTSNGQDITVNNDLAYIVPQINVTNDVVCEGQTIELNSNSFGGQNLQYIWWFDDGSGANIIGFTSVPTFFIPNATATQSGLYSVSVTMGLCESTMSNLADIEVTNIYNGQAPELTASSEVLCEGESLELNSSILTGSNVTYNWWFDNGNGPMLLTSTDVPTYFIDNVDPSNEGVYLVSAMIGGCETQLSNVEDVFINNNIDDALTLSVSSDQLCEGESLELNATPINGNGVVYQWWFDNGNGPVLLGTSDIPTYFVDDLDASNQGLYTVKATIGACASQVSNGQDVSINNALETAPQLSVNDDVLCEGEMLELNSSIIQGVGVQYHWYFNDGSGPVELAVTDMPTLFLQDAGIDNSGIYYVAASIGNCETQFSNAQDIEVQESPDIAISNTTDSLNVACPGDMIEFDVPFVLGATYTWTGPAGFSSNSTNPIVPSAAIENAGMYRVTIETEGCTFNSEPTVAYVFDRVDTDDDEFQLMENDSITTDDLMFNDLVGNIEEWEISLLTSPTNGSIEIGENNELVYHPKDDFSGNDVFIYSICNVDCPDDCDEAVVNIRVFSGNEEEECFVPNIITPNNDGANDYFNVPCLESEYTDNNLKVFNRWGDMVHQAQPYENNWGGTYKNTPLPPGTYFYILQLDVKHEECLQGYFTITR